VSYDRFGLPQHHSPHSVSSETSYIGTFLVRLAIDLQRFLQLECERVSEEYIQEISADLEWITGKVFRNL
jgi:hypothetical protein